LALPVNEQRIGKWFSTNKENFSVYDAYCANQESASEIAVRNAAYYTESWSKIYNKFNNLPVDTPVNPNNQIPSYLIRPVQRLCKYPLLLERLYKHDQKENHPYYEELKEGLEAIKEVVDRTNEAKRKNENHQKVIELNQSVENWKGLQTDQFGELLLMEQFDVSSFDGNERILDVYLFKRILLSFKESGKQKRLKFDKTKVPLVLKNSIFTSFISSVEDVSVPDQMKFQFKVEFMNGGEGVSSIILRTKKGLDLVEKWVKTINELKGTQKQSAFNNNTQLISNYTFDPSYAQQYQYDSSEEEYTEEQLQMRKRMDVSGIPPNQSSYTSTLANQQKPVPLRSSSFTRQDSQEYNSSLSQSYSSTSSSYYGAGNEPRNPQYDIYHNNSNYYDDSFLDDYLGFESDPEDEEYRRGSVSSNSYNPYYSGSSNQYQPQYPNSGQNYYSHSRSNSNQYSSQSSRNSSYPEMPTPNFVPPPTMPYENNRMVNIF